ncbi:MAG: outer membrane lipoprotein LolB [Gammaproteobacteria bacterium]
MKKSYYLILLVFLTGCSEIPLRSERDNDIAQQNQREQIKRWKLNGRLSLTSEKENGTVTFHWTQDDERYLMRFIAPLGQGTFALRGGEGDGVYLLTPKNEMLHAEDAESLLTQSVGWHVPMSGFKYWVRGLPKPGVEITNQQYDELGRVAEMQQDDWKISIKRYMDVDGIGLPGKIFMHNDHFKLKLIIQAWDMKL